MPAAEATVAPERDYQFCTEFIVRGDQLPPSNEVRAALHQFGGSVVVAVAGDILKAHVHTDAPEAVFTFAGRWGTVTSTKADDMRAQHRALAHAVTMGGAGLHPQRLRAADLLVSRGNAPAAIRAMGDKTAARRQAQALDIPVVPGTDEPVPDADAAAAWASRAGYPVPPRTLERDVTSPVEPDPEVQRILIDVYRRDPTRALVCERLIDFDEGLMEWRYRHVKMVERTIGHRSGTGGSSGAEYLRNTVGRNLFPDLWEIRARL